MVIRQPMPWLSLVTAAAAAGCIQAADPGAFICGDGGACPSPQVCASDNRCYPLGEGPDGGTADAGHADAGPEDAGTQDGGVDAGRVCPEASGCSVNLECATVLGCVCAAYLSPSDCCIPPSSPTACRSDSDCCLGAFAGAGCIDGQCACLPAGQTCTPTTGAFCCSNLKCQAADAGGRTCQ
jgi:hypothetical protein